jgi:hypothetical protein
VTKVESEEIRGVSDLDHKLQEARSEIARGWLFLLAGTFCAIVPIPLLGSGGSVLPLIFIGIGCVRIIGGIRRYAKARRLTMRKQD